MLFTKEEIKVAVIALVFEPVKDNQPKRRVFDMLDLKTASDVFQKLNSSVDDKNLYQDGDLEFTTQEKALLLSSISRPWDVADGKAVLSLKAKLE